ncbi:hypothetical protein [Planctopirus ephydatiae]|nr:hypothetical protein [Planctopirus ephydatiae]
MNRQAVVRPDKRYAWIDQALADFHTGVNSATPDEHAACCMLHKQLVL